MTDVPTIQIPRAFEALRRPKRIKVFYGGRGSGKSESIARQLLLNAESSPDAYKMLCAREFQTSIDDSVHGMLKAFIDEYDFPFYVTDNKVDFPNGGGAKFKGLARNIGNIKSLFAFDVIWVEEAENVQEKTWDIVIPTLRKSGSEIWISFNPQDEMDATYQMFVAPYLDTINERGFYEDDEIYVRRVNYQDNPFFPDELRNAALAMKEKNYKKYLHIYEGEPNMDYLDSIIEPEWFDAAVDAHIKLGIKPRGERVQGFDVADSGKDAKATTNRHGILVEQHKMWLEGDVSDGIDRAFECADKYRCDDFVYDNIGVGAAVKVHLKKAAIPRGMSIHGFGGADGVDNPDDYYGVDDSTTVAEDDGYRKNRDMFKNKRAQYWWYLRERFEKTYQAVVKGEYINPDELISLSSDLTYLKELKSELIKVQRKRGGNSRLIQIESKDDMKKRGAASPNLADSLVMSFANPVEPETTHYVRRGASGWRH